jgi:hypothetical protein
VGSFQPERSDHLSKWSSAFRDSRWQKKRLEVMERDKWACRSCGAGGEGVTLNVHHAYYEAGKAPWEYDDDTLVTFCEKCHGNIHALQKMLMVSIISAGDQHNRGVRGLLKYLLGVCDYFRGPPSFDNIDYNAGYGSAVLDFEMLGSMIAHHMSEGTGIDRMKL